MAPGKAHREGLTLQEIMRMFPDDETAERWFIEGRWPSGICCPQCGSLNVQTGCAHKTMPFRCREPVCGKRFSTKTGTVMEGSKISYPDWAIAVYLLTSSLKSVSSMKLHRDLGITQKSAWCMAHRLRNALESGALAAFAGPVEVDETYCGGQRKNMPKHKRERLTGRGAAGKAAVVGARDRASKQVAQLSCPIRRQAR